MLIASLDALSVGNITYRWRKDIFMIIVITPIEQKVVEKVVL